MKSNFLQNAIVGMGFGFPITVASMLLIGGFSEVLTELLVWMIASALYGILSGAIFFRRNELSLPVAFGLHCLGCLLITLGAAAVCGYLTSPASVIPVLIPHLVIYAAVYALCIFMMKQNERQINRTLEEK